MVMEHQSIMLEAVQAMVLQDWELVVLVVAVEVIYPLMEMVLRILAAVQVLAELADLAL